MDRASDSGSEGWGFESLPAYQKSRYPFGYLLFCLCRGRDSKDKIPQSGGLWAAPAGGCRTLQFANGKLQRVPSGRAVPAANFAPSWSVIVLALTRPVSLLRWKLGCRYSLSSTNPKADRQLTSRWLPQAPAVPAPSGRELWGAYLSTSDFCNM